ncbi:MAG: cytochrome C oxidase subunit IV family protein [Filomicrobium sp.]
MRARALIEAWAVLVGLSAATTILSIFEVSGRGGVIIAGFVLLLAGIKARVILSRYLQLRNSRFWTRSFDFAIGSFLLLSFGLFAVAIEY